VARMRPGQDRIYYLIAESVAAGRDSPHLELLKQKGVEVLLLADRIDEWVMGQVTEFEGKRLKDAARGELELGGLTDEADKHKADEDLKENKGLLKRVKDALGERVLEVRVSRRLQDSPVCLVRAEGELGAQLRRVLAASGQELPASKPVLELNVAHPLARYLDSLQNAEAFNELALLLFDQATLSEDGQLANPGDYARRLNGLLGRLIGAGEKA